MKIKKTAPGNYLNALLALYKATKDDYKTFQWWKICKSCYVSPGSFAYILEAGFMVKHPEVDLYKWYKPEMPPTSADVEYLFQVIGDRKIGNKRFSILKPAREFLPSKDLSRFSIEEIIEELKKRGFGGKIVPPSPTSIIF